MLYVAIGQLVIIAVLLHLLHREHYENLKVLVAFSDQAEAERRELLNRIAQPGMIVPTSPAAGLKPQPPRDIKAYNAIGTVQKAKPDVAQT